VIAAGSLEYALARMQAHLGRRLPESAWRSIEQSRDAAPILELCRATCLEDVAAKLSASSDLHAVDAAIREGWRRAAGEALEWMPAEFAPALAWLGTPTVLAWYAEWEHHLPPAAPGGAALAGLMRDVDRHLARFRTAAVHEATPLRRGLEARFVACFRRHPLEPAAAFAWLGIRALDLERLRGELARRVAFPRARLVP
jgi:hypothetical protein